MSELIHNAVNINFVIFSNVFDSFQLKGITFWFVSVNYRYFSPKPIFQLSYGEGSYECRLTLPPTAAFQTIVGPSTRNSNLSKQLVCLEACKKLHQLGALNDHLLPFIEEISEFDTALKSNVSTSRAGTYPWRHIPSLCLFVWYTHKNCRTKNGQRSFSKQKRHTFLSFCTWKYVDGTAWTLLVYVFVAINGLGVSILIKLFKLYINKICTIFSTLDKIHILLKKKNLFETLLY